MRTTSTTSLRDRAVVVPLREPRQEVLLDVWRIARACSPCTVGQLTEYVAIWWPNSLVPARDTVRVALRANACFRIEADQ